MTQHPALKTAGVVVALATLAGPPATHARTRTHGEAPEVRTLDGDGNNRRHPRWGTAGARYSRVAKATYADGVGAMVGGPPVRHLSNRIFEDGGQNLFSENGVTHWGFAWGQFLDHGFGLREQDGERAPIAFDRADPCLLYTSPSPRD